GPVAEQLCEILQIGAVAIVEVRGSGRVVERLQAQVAARLGLFGRFKQARHREHDAEQGRGRVADGAANRLTGGIVEVELRIAELAGDRNGEVDHAVAVAQQPDNGLDRHADARGKLAVVGGIGQFEVGNLELGGAVELFVHDLHGDFAVEPASLQ